MPNYPLAVSIENSRKILEALAYTGGVATFSEIETASSVTGSILTHHLNRLQRFNVIQRETKGTYRLSFKTPLCFVFDIKQKAPISYLGLLGQRESRGEPEPQVALKLLEKEHLKPDLMYVVTSPEALNDWKHLKLPYHWILCYEDEIINVDLVKKKITPQLMNLLKDSIVIMDCTSATKPATIAYYELARIYCVPLIYIYEETKQLKWLLSKETIRKELGMT